MVLFEVVCEPDLLDVEEDELVLTPPDVPPPEAVVDLVVVDVDTLDEPPPEPEPAPGSFLAEDGDELVFVVSEVLFPVADPAGVEAVDEDEAANFFSCITVPFSNVFFTNGPSSFDFFDVS